MQLSERNKKVVERLIDTVFINHDLSALDEIMRDDYIQHNEDVPQGKAGFKDFFITTFKAMPNFRYTVRKIVAEDDIVMVYSTTTATHTDGKWLGQPPTGNSLNFDVVDIFRVEDGLIAEHWDVADSLKLFTQLGIAKSLPVKTD